jgi:uncharacterized membrane protein
MSTATLQLGAPTNDERSNALLMYVLSIFSGFLAPLIFFLIKKDSAFVKFHALQALIFHAVLAVLSVLAVMAIFISMVFLIPSQQSGERNGAPPLAFFGVFGMVCLLIMGGWLLNLILGIVFAIKANQGEWAQYPLIGKLALRGAMPSRPIS